jgi:hypothetical protein
MSKLTFLNFIDFNVLYINIVINLLEMKYFTIINVQDRNSY